VLKGLALAVLFKIMLLVVVAVQLGEPAPPAFAQTPPAQQGQAAAPAAPATPAGQAAPAGSAAAAPATAAPAAGMEGKATEMAPRDKQRAMEELDRRERQVKELEKQVEQKLVRLQELESNLKRLLEEANTLKDEKLRHLVDVYSNMKAQQAAAVLTTLDEKISVKILAGMRGRQAGEILSFVPADKAAKLSEALTKLQVPFE
jgi:flagellar motility protein MotE (MotC chaperone)